MTTHSEPTSEAVEAALSQLWQLVDSAYEESFNECAATLRAALTAAEERARKAEAGMEWLAIVAADAYRSFYDGRVTAPFDLSFGLPARDVDYLLAAARDAVEEGR